MNLTTRRTGREEQREKKKKKKLKTHIGIQDLTFEYSGLRSQKSL